MLSKVNFFIKYVKCRDSKKCRKGDFMTINKHRYEIHIISIYRHSNLYYADIVEVLVQTLKIKEIFLFILCLVRGQQVLVLSALWLVWRLHLPLPFLLQSA